MDIVIRAAIIYFALVVIFRLAGKRSIAQVTTFDFILLLIIAEAVQQAIVVDDYSLTRALLLVVTLVIMDIGLSIAKQRWPAAARLFDGLPVIIVEDGKPLRERMDAERVDENDVLQAAREIHGLEHMGQVKHAVLETNGGISVIPRS
jgi:uncharacterized membrane protein YcaP (DUF421 family)